LSVQDDDPLSPTGTRVLDAFLAALRADADISDQIVGRLDALLRKGKVPKSDEIEVALFPPEANHAP
jgi:hypothetical protein